MRLLVWFHVLLAVARCTQATSDFFGDELEGYDNVLDRSLERRKHDWDKDAIIVAKVFVPAAVHNDFVDAWLELEKGTQQEDGNLVYDMKKTQTDNRLFVIYGHWKTWNDYMAHLDSKHMDKFQEFVKNEEINVRIIPFKRVTDADVHHGKKKSTSKDLMHAAFSFWVDPVYHKDFIKRWEKLADETSKEKSVHIFSLRQSEVDNLMFTVYGTWDSVEDFHQHHWSKHTHDFHQYLAKHNIVWKLWPLQKIGTQPEAVPQ